MWLYIFQGIGYGFAAGVQPGPLQTYIISQTLTKGWRRVLPAAFAPLISDGPIITICLLVLSQVPLWLQRFLYIAGGLFVLYLAYGAYQTWKHFDPTDSCNRIRESKKYFESCLRKYIESKPLHLLDIGYRSDPFDWLA